MWTSWIFVAGAWERVAEADGIEAASTSLGIAARRRGVKDNRRFALTGGAPPSWTPGMASKGMPADAAGIR